MDEYIVQGSDLRGIADGIREKNGTSEQIPFENFESDIKAITSITEAGNPYKDTATITNWNRWFANGERLKYAEFLDTSGGTDFSYMFYNNVYMKDDEFPFDKIDTSNGENFEYCMRNCREFTGSNFALNLSKGKNLRSMFSECRKMIGLPVLDIPLAVNLRGFLYNCSKLVTVNGLKISNLYTSNMELMFYGATSLTNINFIGEGQIKVNSNDLSLADSPNLTVESLVSLFDALADNTGEETVYTVNIGSKNASKLSYDQKLIALLKNIDIQ